MLVSLNCLSDRPHAFRLLLYLAQFRDDKVSDGTMDYANLEELFGSRIPSEEERKTMDLHVLVLGDGVHVVKLDGVLRVEVKPLIMDKALFACTEYPRSRHGKIVTLDSTDLDAKRMALLMSQAEKYTDDLMHERVKSVQQFGYDAKHNFIRQHSAVQKREAATLFLKEGQREQIFDTVKTFLDNRDDYARFHVPYKLNILFHGIPGTGKTSIIKALASHFSLNLMVIPYTEHLNDESLSYALCKASQFKCRLVALEDVHCLFKTPDDKAVCRLTLSGLLNNLDGLQRDGSDGLILVLTANSTEHFDRALIRSARMDLIVHFTHADRFQTRACFEYYWPLLGGTEAHKEATWARLWAGIECLSYSTAVLQQFFFRARGDGRLKVDDFKKLVKDAEGGEAGGGMYV